MKKKAGKLLKIIMSCVGLLVGVLIIYNLYLLLSTPESYMIPRNDNYIDYQHNLECSGYASAYVARQLGEDVTALDLYTDNPYKNADGTVPPPALKKYLKEKGYKASLHTGSILRLKKEISKGEPVVVFVRVSPHSKYTHYLPIVGYDKDNFYAIDSLEYMANEENENYNRWISREDFEKMWDTDASIKKIYMKISLK